MPAICPFETMSVADMQRQLTDCRGCQPGYFCPWGISGWSACPAGDWCPPVGYMNDNRAQDNKCPPGTYNPDTLKVYLADCLQCDGGYYCPKSGMAAVGPLCPKGSYCPFGSIAPIKCRPGTFIDFEGGIFENDCMDCPIGSYCPEGAKAPIVCNPGQMCQGGTAIPVLCPGGYFCNNQT
jgi:hypothetical protein